MATMSLLYFALALSGTLTLTIVSRALWTIWHDRPQRVNERA